jgi:hypothetical protein
VVKEERRIKREYGDRERKAMRHREYAFYNNKIKGIAIKKTRRN